MEEKKSSKASLEDKRVLFLLIGFVMVLSLVYISLEWTDSEVTVYDTMNSDFLLEDELDVMQTSQEPVSTPTVPTILPTPLVPRVLEVLRIVSNNKEIATVEVNSELEKTKEMEELTSPEVVPVAEEEDGALFEVVETMPAFPGGEMAFVSYLNNNLNYPFLAEKNRIQGRVTCQFIVNVDGSISDAAVLVGVEASLNQEALRVIQLMPRWSPAKRKGKPVRVKYTMPIIFALQ